MSLRASEEHGQDSMQVDSTPSPSAIASASTSSVRVSPPNAVGAATTPKVKLKRNRLTISCIPCHTRKQKCDRNQPCQRCVKRGDVDQCVYSTPRVQHRPLESVAAPAQGGVHAPPTASPDDGLTHRVAHLESLVNATISGLGNTSIPGLSALLQIVNANNPPPSPPSIQLPQANPTLPENAVQVAAAALGQLSRQTLNRDSTETQFLDQLKFNETVVQPGDPASVIHSILPERDIINNLINFFFERSSIPYLYPFLHRPSFDYTFATFISGRAPLSIDFVGLLAVICTLALQFIPNNVSSAEILRNHLSGRVALQKRLVVLSQAVLVSMGKSHFPAIERVQGQCLLALYYANENDLHNYNLLTTLAVRNAQAFGLHREVAPNWNVKPQDAEIRRRLWGCIYHLDRFTCFFLKQPFLIHEKHCNVAMPSNIDLSLLGGDNVQTSRPINEFTDYTFHIAQIKLAKLLGDVWEQCFNVTLPTYATVMSLDDSICEFEHALPPQPQASPAPEITSATFVLNFQKLVMALQTTSTRLILLRNCLFKGSSHSQELDPRVNETAHRTEELHRQARLTCILLCKQAIALFNCLCTLDGTKREHLRWATHPMSLFNATLTLAVAASIQSDSQTDEDSPQWTRLADKLIREFNHDGAFHPNLVSAIGVLHRRTQDIYGSATQSQALPSSEKMSTVLKVEPESLLKKASTDDNRGWASVQATVYSNSFPSVEIIGDMNEATLIEFCNSCVV